MKRIFLSSSINFTARAIFDEIKKEFGDNKKKLLFIKTASELKKRDLSWLDDDRNGLVKAGFDVMDFTVTGKTTDEINLAIKNNDIIHFNGGNNFYLLKQLQLSKSMELFRRAVEDGKIYSGSSAGSIIAAPNVFPTRTLDKMEDLKKLEDFTGLSIVDFLTFPHWGSEYFRDKYLNQRLEVAYSGNDKIILLRDNQYISVRGDEYKIIGI